MYLSHAKCGTGFFRRAIFLAAAILTNVVCQTAIAADENSLGDGDSIKIDERFYANTVLSTSLDTPGAARTISIEDTRIVRGTILTADGKPVKDAEVWGVSLTALPPIRERAKTDVDGKYQLDLLPNTNWSVVAFKNNESVDVTGEAPWNSLNRVTTLVDARLGSGCVMKGDITNQDNGQAISGVRIYLDDGRILISDSSGSVDMSGLKRGKHDAVVLVGGFEIKQVTFQCLSESENHLRVQLHPANLISGQVVNEIEAPLAHAWVARSTKIPKSLAADGTYLLTDEQGRFAGPNNPLAGSSRMQDLLDRQMTIARAGAFDYVSKSVDPLIEVTKSAKPINIVLREQPVRSPRSHHERLKTPGGSEIHAYNFSPTNDQPSEEELSGTSSNSSTRAEEMLQAKLVYPEEPNDLFAGFGDDKPAIKEQRRIVDSEGAPIAGVRIEPTDFFGGLAGGFFKSMLEAKETVSFSDAQGYFSFSKRSMSSHSYVFSHEMFANRVIDKSELEGSTNDVKMEPRRFVRARVVDEIGNPVRDFKVELKLLRKPGEPMRSYDSFDPLTYESVSNDGTFAYHDQWRNSGSFLLTVKAAGMMNCVNEVTINADQNDEKLFTMKRQMTLRVNAAPATETSETSKPISKLTLATLPRVETFSKSDLLLGLVRCVPHAAMIVDNANMREIAVQQPRGAFAIEAPGFARQYFDWRLGASQYDVKLVPESIIAGTIESKLVNAPPLTLWLTCLYDRYSIKTPAAKEFQITNLAGGWYRLRLVQDNQPLITSNLFIKTGERLELNYQIDENGQIKLNDQNHSGNAQPDEIQFTVNGKAQRHSSVDEYVAAIKNHIAEKSEEFGNNFDKKSLFDIFRKRMDQIRNNPIELQYQGNQIALMQNLIDDEKWPEGIEYVYCDPTADQADKPYLVLCVPTPEAEMIDQKLILNF